MERVITSKSVFLDVLNGHCYVAEYLVIVSHFVIQILAIVTLCVC